MSQILTRLHRAITSPSSGYHSLYIRAWKGTEIVRAAATRFLGRQLATHTQIVICGYPRSGTSLLYNMISASLDGFVFDEYEVTALASIWKRENHVSKLPLDILNVERILRNNIHKKRLFIILPVRDIRDIITSIHSVRATGYYIDYESSQGRQRGGDHVVRNVGVHKIHSAIVRAKAIAPDNLIFVRYEELVDDPDRVQDELASSMAIHFARRFSRFHESPDKHAYRHPETINRTIAGAARESSSPDRTRIGKWRHPKHRDRIREQFNQHPELFQILRRDGYESDDSWFDAYGPKVGCP